MHLKLTRIIEKIRERPSYFVLFSMLFGVLGALVDALIDYFFYYEENLLEVLLPEFHSHEFYMRMMLIITLASFSLFVVFLLKQINKYDIQLKKVNENLEEIVSQRTKEFGDLFSQSPFAKALLSSNLEIVETNNAWNRIFNFDKTLMKGFKLLDHRYFNLTSIEKDFTKVLKEKESSKTESIYFEEIDKILTINTYPITNSRNDVEKIVCNLEDVTDKLKRHESDRELETKKITMKTIFDFIESERSRLANELHDDVGQKLMITKLHLELLKKECEKFPEKFDEIITLIQGTNGDIKKIIFALHPSELKNYGLINAIQSRLNHCSGIGNFKAEFKTFGEPLQTHKEVELGIYRICQEALSNVTKHATAKKVVIKINFNKTIVSGLIQDDGSGFVFDEVSNLNKKYGLISMKERANILGGTLEIESSINNGTKVHFEIPVLNEG